MQKGGENGAVVDVLDLYSITLNLEARNSDFGEWVIVDDKELRRLDGDAEQLLEAIEEYIYAWQDNILFPSALEMAGLEYHGGWMFDKEVDKFYTLPFELEQFTMIPDLEAVAKRAEEIRAWVTQRNTGRVTEAISNPMTPAGLLAAQRAKQKA